MVILVAMIVLVAVGVLLWKAMAAQAVATSSTSDDTPTGPTRATGGPGRARRPRPVAPDDDPEFLRSLDDRLRRSDSDDPPAS